MLRQRRDQQEAFFGGTFPQKAEPQHGHGSQRADSLNLHGYEFIAFKIYCFTNLGGSIKPPETPLDPPQHITG